MNTRCIQTEGIAHLREQRCRGRCVPFAFRAACSLGKPRDTKMASRGQRTHLKHLGEGQGVHHVALHRCLIDRSATHRHLAQEAVGAGFRRPVSLLSR